MWKNKVQFFHTSLQNAWGRFAPFPQASPPSIHKQQNRTFHLLQKPDISICYRHKELGFALFSEMDLSSEDLLASNHIWHFIAAGLPDHFAELRPHIERLLRSTH